VRKYYYRRTKLGLRWGPRSVLIPDVDMGRCPGCQAGIVSPKCLNGDDARQAIGVWSGVVRCSGCLRDRQDDFEVLEGLPTWFGVYRGWA